MRLNARWRWAMISALLAVVAGCDAHQSGAYGHHHSAGPLDAVILGLAVVATIADAATPPPPPPPPPVTTVTVHAAPAPPARHAQAALPGWVVADSPPVRVGAGVKVTVAGSSGVVIHLQTSENGRFTVPMPLPEGRYTAFVDDGELYGRVTFLVGSEPLPPLYLEAQWQQAGADSVD